MGIDFSFNPVPKPSHKRKAPKRGDRNKFSKYVRDQVKEHFENICQMCGGKGHHVHHTMPRSRGGRGIFSNGLLLCNDCHKLIHSKNELLKYWIEEFKKKYGKNFYKDRDDLIAEYKTYFFDESDNEIKEWLKHNG